MRSLRSLFFILAGLASFIEAKSSSGESVLVVVEAKRQANYSKFFDGLTSRGYDLTFREPKAESPAAVEYGVPTFSHVIVLASETKSLPNDLSPQSLVELTNLKTNLILTLSSKQTTLSSLATEFSLVPSPSGQSLYSYFPERSDPATVIPVNVPQSRMFTPNTPPVWFSGVPHALGNNPMLVHLLKAPAESFAAELDTPDAVVDAAEKAGEGLWAGSQLGLVTGFQTLAGARVTFVGGADLLSDEFTEKETLKGGASGNAQFAQDVAAWTFQESLVLRIDKTTHFLANTTISKEQYTTNDQIEYSAYISAYNPKKGKWKPYSGINDMQLEFTMLDPHIRTALPPVPGSPGKYSTTFRAPDRHGVFKFVINWKRTGWSYLQSSTTVPVVPPRHDGYPRFLSAAWPYYAGAISTSVAFFIFSAMWLAGDNIRPAKKGKGTKAE